MLKACWKHFWIMFKFCPCMCSKRASLTFYLGYFVQTKRPKCHRKKGKKRKRRWRSAKSSWNFRLKTWTVSNLCHLAQSNYWIYMNLYEFIFQSCVWKIWFPQTQHLMKAWIDLRTCRHSALTVTSFSHAYSFINKNNEKKQLLMSQRCFTCRNFKPCWGTQRIGSPESGLALQIAGQVPVGPKKGWWQVPWSFS